MARNHQSKKSAAEHHQMQDDKTIRLGRKHGLTELSDQQILEFSRELRGTKSKTQMVRERKRAAKLRKAGKTGTLTVYAFGRTSRNNRTSPLLIVHSE